METGLAILSSIAGIAGLFLTVVLERHRIREALARLGRRKKPASCYAAFGDVIVNLYTGEVVGFVSDPPRPT